MLKKMSEADEARDRQEVAQPSPEEQAIKRIRLHQKRHPHNQEKHHDNA